MQVNQMVIVFAMNVFPVMVATLKIVRDEMTDLSKSIYLKIRKLEIKCICDGTKIYKFKKPQMSNKIIHYF